MLRQSFGVDGFEGGGDVVGVVFGVVPAEGEGDEALGEVFGAGKVLGSVAGSRPGFQVTEGRGRGMVGAAGQEVVAMILGIRAGAFLAVYFSPVQGIAEGRDLTSLIQIKVELEPKVSGRVRDRTPREARKFTDLSTDDVLQEATMGTNGIDLAELDQGNGGREFGHTVLST